MSRGHNEKKITGKGKEGPKGEEPVKTGCVLEIGIKKKTFPAF